MKFKLQSVLLAAALIALPLLTLPAPVQAAQITSPSSFNLFASNALTFSITSSNLTGGQLKTNPIVQGSHLTLFPQWYGATSTNTGALLFRFQLVYASNALKTTFTNFTTTTLNGAGTSVTRDAITINATNFGGANGFVISGVTNLSDPVSTVTLTNCFGQWTRSQ